MPNAAPAEGLPVIPVSPTEEIGGGEEIEEENSEIPLPAREGQGEGSSPAAADEPAGDSEPAVVEGSAASQEPPAEKPTFEFRLLDEEPAAVVEESEEEKIKNETVEAQNLAPAPSSPSPAEESKKPAARQLSVAERRLLFTRAQNEEDWPRALELAASLAGEKELAPEDFAKAIFVAIEKEGKASTALEISRKLTTTHPLAAKAWNFFGWSALATGDLDKAGEALEKARELDPSLPEVFLNLGDLQITLDKPPAAARDFYKKAIELDGPAGAITRLAQERLRVLEAAS